MAWLLLIGLHLAGTGGFNILLRRSQLKHTDQWFTATVLQTGLFLPFLVKQFFDPVGFSAFAAQELLLLAGAVAMLITLQYCNVKALQYLEASTFSVVFNMRVLFATVLSIIFLHESLGAWTLLGGFFVFAAIFIVRQKGAKAVTKRGVLFGLGAAAAISVMTLCEKILIKQVGYEQYIFPMFAAAAVIMWIIVFIRRTPAPFHLLIERDNLLLMAFRAAGGIGFSWALVYGSLAVSSYLSSLSVVLIMVFGMVFLGERDHMRAKLAATLVAILGLTLIFIDKLN